METKECTKCYNIKNIEKFVKNKSYCKICKNEYERNRRKPIREKINAITREKYKEKKMNAQPIIIDEEKSKLCTICNIEKKLTEFYINKYRENIRSECKDCSSNRRKKYYKDNRDYVIKQTSQYKENKKKTNPIFKLECVLRNRVYIALKSQGQNKRERTINLLGCSSKFFQKWIEFQLYDGMTFENYGDIWHIDHCKPCSLFNLSDINQRYECFHWSNLRPLLATKNLQKYNNHNHYEYVLQELKSIVFSKIHNLDIK